MSSCRQILVFRVRFVPSTEYGVAVAPTEAIRLIHALC